MVRTRSRGLRSIRYNDGLVDFCDQYLGLASLDSTKRKTWIWNHFKYRGHSSCDTNRCFLFSSAKQLPRWRYLLFAWNCDGGLWLRPLHHLWPGPRAPRWINDSPAQQKWDQDWPSASRNRRFGVSGRMAPRWNRRPRNAALCPPDRTIDRSFSGSRFSNYRQVARRLSLSSQGCAPYRTRGRKHPRKQN